MEKFRQKWVRVARVELGIRPIPPCLLLSPFLLSSSLIGQSPLSLHSIRQLSLLSLPKLLSSSSGWATMPNPIPLFFFSVFTSTHTHSYNFLYFYFLSFTSKPTISSFIKSGPSIFIKENLYFLKIIKLLKLQTLITSSL